MSLFYDPITDEAGPSRTWEQDEEEFEELYGSKGHPSYELKFLPASDNLRDGGKLQADLLLVGVSAAGQALLSQLGDGGEVVGTISQAQKDSDEDRPKRDPEQEGQLIALGNSTVIVSVPDGVPPEGAVAWTRVLFAGVSPARIVVLGLIPRAKFLGKVDDGAAPPIYTVETSAQQASTRQLGREVSYLPTGNLVDGVAAAIISHCQTRRMAGTLLVNIEQTSGPDHRTLQAVVDAIVKGFPQSRELTVDWSEIVVRSRKELATKARKQSWSELYS